jgi:putative acyl-CoA dehydrogenase
MTPILKLFSAKECIGVISEGLESFGGIGYMENSGLPRILRDA